MTLMQTKIMRILTLSLILGISSHLVVVQSTFAKDSNAEDTMQLAAPTSFAVDLAQ